MKQIDGNIRRSDEDVNEIGSRADEGEAETHRESESASMLYTGCLGSVLFLEARRANLPTIRRFSFDERTCSKSLEVLPW